MGLKRTQQIPCHGYTVRGTPNCPLTKVVVWWGISQKLSLRLSAVNGKEVHSLVGFFLQREKIGQRCTWQTWPYRFSTVTEPVRPRLWLFNHRYVCGKAWHALLLDAWVALFSKFAALSETCSWRFHIVWPEDVFLESMNQIYETNHELYISD